MDKLSHYDAEGSAHMVDVSAKPATRREAEASAFVVLSEAVLAALPQNPKGNPLEVARFAGIQAAKRTADLIPMCHPLPLSFIDVSATVVSRRHRDPQHGCDGRRHRRRNGGADSRRRGRAHDLRHVQGDGQIHCHPRNCPGAEIGRQERRIYPQRRE